MLGLNTSGMHTSNPPTSSALSAVKDIQVMGAFPRLQQRIY